MAHLVGRDLVRLVHTNGQILGELASLDRFDDSSLQVLSVAQVQCAVRDCMPAEIIIQSTVHTGVQQQKLGLHRTEGFTNFNAVQCEND
jgi:hypothetical protein